MKTKNILPIVALAAALVSTGCSQERLDIEQKGVSTTAEYARADDDGVKQFVAALYSFVRGDVINQVMGEAIGTFATVNWTLGRMAGETADYFSYTDDTDASTYSQPWAYYYRLAYWSNMIITNLPENTVASAAVKTQAIAEARTIRAIAMMNLVQLYGNPPLADHILDGSEGCTPAAESWEFIESELNAAASDLPTKSGVDGQASIGGRLTREAAYAYLGKALLWQGKWDDAAAALDKVISSDKYALVSDFALLNSSASDFSSENIWEFDFCDDLAYSDSQEGRWDIAAFSPNIPGFTSKYASYSMGFSWGSCPTTDFVNFMKAHDGLSARYQETLLDMKTAADAYGAQITYPYTECEGYLKVKGLTLAEDLVAAFPYANSKKNVVYMRYAEVLLNYAEAVAQGGAAGSISGLEALNLVRRRAGLSNASSLSMDDASYGVKAERRAELFGEGARFIDLVRWGDAGTVLSKTGTQTPVCLGVNADGSYNITWSATGGNGFKTGKNELFPYPMSDASRNSGLVQNIGW